MRALLSLVISAPLLISALACGEVGDVEKRPPLAVLDGQLSQASPQALRPGANVRVAVVWLSVDGGYSVAQDIPVTPVFPAKFHLELSDPPPATAMAHGTPGRDASDLKSSRDTWPADFGVAIGSVVAYEDTNGNGKLDLVDQSATAFVDRVLGVNGELLLLYFEGNIVPSDFKTDAAGNRPAQGYNLAGTTLCAGKGTCNHDSDGWLPMTTLYDLPLSADPQFGKVMCQGLNEGFGESTVTENFDPGPAQTGPGPDGVWPQPGDPELWCDVTAHGRRYQYTKCQTSAPGLCTTAQRSCTVTAWEFRTPSPPAGWPCVVTPF